MVTKAILAAIFVLSATTAGLAADPAKIRETAKGRTLTDGQGMTLYTFDKDADGKSACSGKCVSNWPPFAASADAQASGAYTIITRDDGSRQWAYKGRLLYTWVKDTEPGAITGDGFLNGAWHVAQP